MSSASLFPRAEWQLFWTNLTPVGGPEHSWCDLLQLPHLGQFSSHYAVLVRKAFKVQGRTYLDLAPFAELAAIAEWYAGHVEVLCGDDMYRVCVEVTVRKAAGSRLMMLGYGVECAFELVNLLPLRAESMGGETIAIIYASVITLVGFASAYALHIILLHFSTVTTPWTPFRGHRVC